MSVPQSCRLKQKAQVCRTTSSHGQLVFPSKSTKCFIRGRCLIPLEVLIMALEAVKIDHIVFYAYGMKALDSHRFLHSYKLPDSPPADHQCLFHSLAGVLKRLYTTSRRPPTSSRRGSFTLSCHLYSHLRYDPCYPMERITHALTCSQCSVLFPFQQVLLVKEF